MPPLTPDFVLDEWDIALIRYLKSSGPNTVDGLKAVWARRNACEAKYISVADLAERMMEIVVGLGLAPVTRLLREAAPDRQWQYSLEAPDGYWGDWLRALSSVLRSAEVRHLPGYREAVTAAPAPLP